MKRTLWFVQVAIGVVVTTLNIIYLPKMPNLIVTHFGGTGQPNGTESPIVGLFVPVLIGWVITVLFYLLAQVTLKGKIPSKNGTDPAVGAWILYVVSILIWLIVVIVAGVLITYNLR